MRIVREGTGKNRGPYEIQLPGPSIRWDPARKCVRMYSHKVADFDTKAHHNYRTFLSLGELEEIITTLGRAMSGDSAPVIAAALSASLQSLLRIALACVEAKDT